MPHNLDNMTPDELSDHANSLRTDNADMLEAELADVLISLKRAENNVAALKSKADELYNKLPDDRKWR